MSVTLNHPPISLMNRDNGTFTGSTVAALSTTSAGPVSTQHPGEQARLHPKGEAKPSQQLVQADLFKRTARVTGSRLNSACADTSVFTI